MFGIMLCLALGAGQEGAVGTARWKLALRVSGARADGLALIDRGSRDRVAVGDLVVFSPRGGSDVTGAVREVFEQRAAVALDTPRATPLATGTRGYVLVDRARSNAPGAGASAETPGQAAGTSDTERAASSGSANGVSELAAPSVPGTAQGWAALDEAWTPEMPLLAGARALHPEERPRTATGRAWTSFDAIFGAGGERSDTFFRAGGELTLSNPFGRGGELVFDAELAHRHVALGPDANDGADDSANLRIDRLFYELGGTRYDDERWTVGRFLSRELPEIGVQDGVEWSRRLEGGDRLGVSAAFLPEPDGRLDGASDLSFTGWYRWVRDEREETMLTAAFQQTFHDGSADRERAILRAHHLPGDGWTLLGAASLDLHSGDPYDDGLALTEAHASAGRRFAGLHDLRLVYDHREYPDLATDEAALIGVESIAEGALDRLGLAGSARLTDDRRLTGRVGMWSDEHDGGGDLEVGVELPLPLLRGGRLSLGSFAAQGRYSELRGGRIAVGRDLERSAWSLAYEVQRDTFEGFDTLNDDAVQHRVRATSEHYSASGWVLSLYAEAQVHDIGDAFLVGFHFGRSF